MMKYYEFSWTPFLLKLSLSLQILTPALAWWRVLLRWTPWCPAWASCPLLFLKTYRLWRRSSTARAAPCFLPTLVSLSQSQPPLISCFTFNLPLKSQLGFMHRYTLFSVLIHLKHAIDLAMLSGVPDQTNRWSLRFWSRLPFHCSEALRACIDLTLGFWQVIYLALEENANRPDCWESHLPLTWVEWLITEELWFHTKVKIPIYLLLFLFLWSGLVLSWTSVI